MRGKNLGSQLLLRAEEIAMDQNCVGIWLDTFEFHAPEFYIKKGYEVFGKLQVATAIKLSNILQMRTEFTVPSTCTCILVTFRDSTQFSLETKCPRLRMTVP
ncbi:GNAT family N-acetyltransferase [Phyllobacterium zundukense]|uniref:GNAT family N-acetyltransferase n=1 Tax=Phyllobacterium zundukense TaxID=1867719 RepID=UPI001F32E328|nr:GNAT family N-acetyltransferase [Phyllobacterium zundukense]